VSASATRARELSAELEAELMRQLLGAWKTINWQLFGSVMRPPTLELSRNETRLGEWRPEERAIVLSRAVVLGRPWCETLEVLKHEMAHQFVSEFLGGEDEPHGPRFRRVCEARGIDASPRHGTRSAEVTREDRVIARVRKLLALAESSNQHEAELAAATAQRLMMKFNIDLQREGGAQPEACRSLWLGEPTGKLQLYHRKLSSIILQYFFVEGIWVSAYRPFEGKTGTVLEVCGRPENLQMAEFVHAFLLRTIERLWEEHKRKHGLRSNQNRRNFLAGALAGFEDKLSAERVRAQAEGLVWVGGKAEREYLHRRYPHRTSTRSSVVTHREGFAEGKEAGRGIVLSRPVETTSSGGARRALPPGRE